MSLIGLLNYFDQKSGQEQYGKLLNEYRVPGDPSVLPLGNTPQELDQSIQQQQGGFRGAGGLLSGGPPQEFYMRAAQLPGYQQLAQQAMVGQQAMERQMQGQQWEANNMSLAQKTQLDMNAQQQQWQRQRQEFEWNNPSAYQQASIEQDQARTGIAAGHLGLAQQEFALKQAQAQRPLFEQLPPQQRMEFIQNVNQLDATARIVTDSLDYISRVGSGEKALDRGTVNAMNAEYRQNVIPYFQRKFQAGALQKGDMEFIESVAGDPGGWSTLDSRQQQRLAGILRSVEDDRTAAYGMAGRQAPPTQRGGSAWARSQSAKSAPQDIQWQMGGP
jgi:hypothetical protein